MKAIYNISLLVMLNITGFTQEVNSCYTEINCHDCNLMLKTQDTFIIDVRLYKAFKKERISGAQIAENKMELEEILKNIDKNTPVIVYCREGTRSRVAAEYICSELKFTEVYNLSNGINEWVNKGYEIEKGFRKN